MPEKRRRALTPRQEAHQPPPALLKKGRRQAKAALEAIKPRVRSLTSSAMKVATKVYGKKAFQILEALADDDVSSDEWLSDVTALAIGHWLKPLESLAMGFGQKVPPTPTKEVHFDIDQYSQAADPVAVDVTPDIYAYAKAGELEAQDINGGSQIIPALHIRYTVSGQLTFVSLVGLEGLGLNAGTIQGPINVRLPPATGYSTGNVVTIGTAHLRVG